MEEYLIGSDELRQIIREELEAFFDDDKLNLTKVKNVIYVENWSNKHED